MGTSDRAAFRAIGALALVVALFLNQRGQRLGVKGAHDIITGIAARGDLDDEITAHVLRHTFATTLVNGRDRPRHRRRAPGTRPPRDHPGLHPPERRGPDPSARSATRRSMTDERLLVGFLVVIGLGVSFVLTIFLFGFVLLAAVLLGVTGAALLITPTRRGAALWTLGLAGVISAGPLIYLGLAFL
ncbi:MAG: tyrosine-type recombinase/integrase [Acidimicrobiia bacterium]